MLTIVKLLLEQQGVLAFHGAAIHLDDFSYSELRDRYREAFEYSGDKQVTVVIGGGEKYFVVDDFGQVWRNRGKISEAHGIHAVLRMPSEIWEKLKVALKPSRIDDLTKVQVAA